ncbi:UNKNOWN [Stylonychia lemnae]|uniref:AAR2 protein n=1 Tax=Stylonychia lemnae TaxID=5949 RepID=A0A078B875_STYLE|nr:UNKNOWN [Stylonychia lemnae]|eukprot:CDW90609.1 UNKNOWN [Stylonychia lemnae]
MQFGIDNQYWQIGPNFKGVKVIPPGAHYVYYSLKDEEFSARMGFFIYINHRQPDNQDVVIRKWNEKNQEFQLLDEQQEEISYQEGVRNMDFDKYLGVYPIDNYQQWQGLSNFIDQNTIKRIESLSNGMILSEEQERQFRIEEEIQQQQEKEENKDNEQNANADYDDIEETIEKLEKQVKDEEKKQQKAKKREYKYKDAYSSLYYSDIPKRKIITHLQGEALTQANFDKSIILQEVLEKSFQNQENSLLGEFQFAFVTFLLGENLESYDQWKKIVNLLCNCEIAVRDKFDLFYKFIPVFYEQLKQLPKDFFQAELSKVNFLNDSLKNFIEICSDQSMPKKLRQRIDKLSQMLSIEYGFLPILSLEQRLIQQAQISNQQKKFDDMDDDDLPIVVDESEGFISF